MGTSKHKKTDLIRSMLLKTLGSYPDLFCYIVSLQEAKQLLGENESKEVIEKNFNKPDRVIVEC